MPPRPIRSIGNLCRLSAARSFVSFVISARADCGSAFFSPRRFVCSVLSARAGMRATPVAGLPSPEGVVKRFHMGSSQRGLGLGIIRV